MPPRDTPNSQQERSTHVKGSSDDPVGPVDAAGIYIKGASNEAIFAALGAYWAVSRGFPQDDPPELLAPFDLQSRGRIGYTLLENPCRTLLLDSERVTADPELAAFLHAKLRVEVVAFCLSESIGRAWWVQHSEGTIDICDDLVVIKQRVLSMPHAFSCIGGRDDEPRASIRLCFDGIIERAAVYSGPNVDSKAARRCHGRRGRWLIKSLQLESFERWLDETPNWESAIGDLGRASLCTEVGQRFVLALEQRIYRVENNAYSTRARRALAEAAFRADEQAAFARVHDTLTDSQKAWDWARLMPKLANEKRFSRALKAFELLLTATEIDEVELWVWNNLCHILCHLEKDAAGAKLPLYVQWAKRRAPENPAIYHNLACLLLRQGDREGALDAVEGAISFNYQSLEDVRQDDDLTGLRDEPRWAEVWSKYDHREVDEPSEVVDTLPACVLTPHHGVRFEGRPELLLTTDTDEHEAILGEPHAFHAAHGVYRYDEVGLTMQPIGQGMIIHRRGASASLAGVQLFTSPVAEVIEALVLLLGRVREVPGGRDTIEYCFEDADVTAYSRNDRPHLVSVILSPKGALKRERRRNRAAELKRERDAQERRRVERCAQLAGIERHFAAVSRFADGGDNDSTHVGTDGH